MSYKISCIEGKEEEIHIEFNSLVKEDGCFEGTVTPANSTTAYPFAMINKILQKCLFGNDPDFTFDLTKDNSLLLCKIHANLKEFELTVEFDIELRERKEETEQTILQQKVAILQEKMTLLNEKYEKKIAMLEEKIAPLKDIIVITDAIVHVTPKLRFNSAKMLEVNVLENWLPFPFQKAVTLDISDILFRNYSVDLTEVCNISCIEELSLRVNRSLTGSNHEIVFSANSTIKNLCLSYNDPTKPVKITSVKNLSGVVWLHADTEMTRIAVADIYGLQKLEKLSRSILDRCDDKAGLETFIAMHRIQIA